MANYQLLKADIDEKVYENAQQKITGANLNAVLNAMVTTLGAEYQFAGVATIDTNPGAPDAKVFYIANGKGTYTNFGGVEVTEDDVVVLYWDSSWHKVSTGIASTDKLNQLGQKIDGLVGNYSAGFINTSRDSTDFTIVYNPAYVVGVFDTYDGNIFKVTGHAGEGPRLWAFTDDAGTIISKSVNDEMLYTQEALENNREPIKDLSYDIGYESGEQYGQGFMDGLKSLYEQISTPEALTQSLEDRILVRQGYGVPEGANPNDPEVQSQQSERRAETESK